MPYSPLSDPQSSYNNPKKGPHASGAPGGGIPLHGDLSPEQESWMRKGRPKAAPGAIESADETKGAWHNHEESYDGDTMVRHQHPGGDVEHTHEGPGFNARKAFEARQVHERNGRMGM